MCAAQPRRAGDGAHVAVLDDAFQHRRAKRDVDVVLLAPIVAGPVRLLPAGRSREPLTSLARASLIVVTRKSASPVRARERPRALRASAPNTGVRSSTSQPDRLVAWLSGESALDLATLRGKTVLATVAIGDPRAFAAQLAEAGARVEIAFGAIITPIRRRCRRRDSITARRLPTSSCAH